MTVGYGLSIVAVNDRIDKSPSLDRSFLSSQFSLLDLWLLPFEDFVIAAVDKELRWWLRADIVKVFVIWQLVVSLKKRHPPPPITYGDAYRNYFRLQKAVLLWYLSPVCLLTIALTAWPNSSRTFTPNNSSSALVASNMCTVTTP